MDDLLFENSRSICIYVSLWVVFNAESAHEHREAEHGDIGFVASREDLIWEEYDLTAEKPDGEEDITKSFMK